MEHRTFYHEILTEHNLHPGHKGALCRPDKVLEGVNPSCGDDIFLQLKLEGNRIADGAFRGEGCAVSQASADMMLDLVIGRTREEALDLAALFQKMIRGEAAGEELELLEEAAVLQDIAHMPARVKCAVLGWRTLEEMLRSE